METEIMLSNEEIVSRITGLPVERVEYLKSEVGMPVSEPEFSAWAVDSFEILFEEQKRFFEQLLFKSVRPELTETAT
jgi:hypothetical protein